MKVFIVGAGLIGKERIKALQNLKKNKYSFIEIVAIIDPIFKEKKKFFFDSCYNTFSDLEEAYSKYNFKIDWVFICTPHFETAQISKLALKFKSNILVEKPLGRNLNEYKEILKESVYNQKVNVGFNYRFFKGVNRLIQDSLNNEFGKIISVNLILGHGNSPGMEKSWKLNLDLAGGGCLLDPGIHLIDIAMLLSKNSLKLESQLNWKGFWNTGIEEEIYFLSKDSNKTIYNFNISLNKWKSVFKIEVNGTLGYGVVNGRGRSYGNQTYIKGKRWGWLGGNSQSESEEIVIDDYSADDSFIFETESVLFRDSHNLKSEIFKIKPGNHLDNKLCLEFINTFNIK